MNRNQPICHFSSNHKIHSVIIGDLYFGSIDPSPDKTQAVLILNANAPLSRAVSLKTFKAISWRIYKVTDIPCKIQVSHAPSRHSCDYAHTPTLSGQKDFSRFLILEGDDHDST